MIYYHALCIRGEDGCTELHLLLVPGHHPHNVLVVKLVLAEHEMIDALETLLHVGLDAQGILRLGQNLQQLIVREEEEPFNKKVSLFKGVWKEEILYIVPREE